MASRGTTIIPIAFILWSTTGCYNIHPELWRVGGPTPLPEGKITWAMPLHSDKIPFDRAGGKVMTVGPDTARNRFLEGRTRANLQVRMQLDSLDELMIEVEEFDYGHLVFLAVVTPAFLVPLIALAVAASRH